MSEQSKAQSLVRQVGISEPQIATIHDDRTLFIEGVPPGDKFEWDCDRNACLFVAVKFGLGVALENGMGKICVCRGHNHKHYFDVVDVLAAHKKTNGFLSNPWKNSKRPRSPNIATMRAKAANGQFDTRRLVVPVQLGPKKPHGAAA